MSNEVGFDRARVLFSLVRKPAVSQFSITEARGSPSGMGLRSWDYEGKTFRIASKGAQLRVSSGEHVALKGLWGMRARASSRVHV